LFLKTYKNHANLKILGDDVGPSPGFIKYMIVNNF